MKTTKICLGVLFLLTFSFITCEEKRSIFAKNIRKFAGSVTKPEKTDELISGFQNKLTLLFYTLTLKELNEVQVKYDLSDSLIAQIKAAQFAESSGMKKVSDTNNLNFYSHEESLGAALRENDGRVSFALIKTRSFANLKPKYETYYEKECKRKWIFFKKCHDLEKQRERELTESEQIIVSQASKYSAFNTMLEAADILQKGDYELYMSDTGSIFSPDKKSVAHVTYFGNIAIGPISELNAILPVDYEYKFISKGNNRGYMVKNPTGDNLEQKASVYPTTKKYNYSDLVIKNNYLHKFNFLIKDQITNYPGEYIYSMIEESEKGPYVLEVKTNGNVILYSQNNLNNILWTTNTANKGKGPYNLHLTNDKKLILEDSTGKILYQSDNYNEAPTIFYGNSEKIYNGLLLRNEIINYFLPLYPNQINLRSDNKINDIGYEIYERYDYKCYPELKDYFLITNNKKIYIFDAYFISDNNNFDICYTVKIYRIGWTSIACNGDEVGFNTTFYNYNPTSDEDYFIENLIVYVKEKTEHIPNISDLPRVYSKS